MTKMRTRKRRKAKGESSESGAQSTGKSIIMITYKSFKTRIPNP